MKSLGVSLATMLWFVVMGTILLIAAPIRWIAKKIRYLVTKLRSAK